tara:strand:+ start:1283 stop:1483 length:201 start_codon:yes stop_codon:yes gene_type:complete
MADQNKRIIYTRDDGGITILIPSVKCNKTIEELQKKDVPSGKKSYIVDKSIIPTDRSFRNAWTYTE